MDAYNNDNHNDANDGGTNNGMIDCQTVHVCDCHTLPLSFFCSHLIEYFDILFLQNKFVWLTTQRMC